MSAPATTTRVSTAPIASTTPIASTAPAAPTVRVTSSGATSIAPTSNLITTRTRSSATRHRTTTITSASSVIPTIVPYDPAEERKDDSHQTNKILIGIFTGFGVVLLGLVAFRLFGWYKRRYRKKGVPLPPPRDGQLSLRSRAGSMYKDYPSDLSRPPSLMIHNGSGSGLITPSVRSNTPSMDARVDQTGRRYSDVSRAPGQISRDYSPDNSLSGSALVLNDEEFGRRRSPLAPRSDSPSNLLPPRPSSQGQVGSRPGSRSRVTRPSSAGANQRYSSFGTPGSMNRNSTFDPSRRASFYGTPHSPHARERVGLVMPQPLASEASNYAPNSIGSEFTQGSTWGNRGSLAAGSDQDRQSLVPPRGPRPDSWIVSSHSSTASLNDSPVTFDAPSKDGTLPRGRDRTSRAEIPRS